MESKMTVVVVNDFDYIQGGASKVAINTAEVLYDNNIDIIFFSSVHKENNYKFKQITLNQKECLKDGLKGAIRSLNNYKVGNEFEKLLNSLDKNNTIIHVHGWTKALSSIIFKIAHKKGFKLVLTQHDYFTVCPNGGFYNFKKQTICKKVPMSFDCVTCNCDSRNYPFKLFRVVRQISQNINTKKLKSIKYLISISDFSLDKIKNNISKDTIVKKIYNPIDIKKEPKININKNNNYIFIGSVIVGKGCEDFCEALTDLNLNGIVVGSGSQLEMLKRKYPNIEFLGWQSATVVKEKLTESKCLIFPSKWYEAAPLTPLEAMACGIPCIANKNCAAREFIKDEHNGYLYDGTVDDLKNTINFYENKDLSELSNNCYNKYWDNPMNSENYYNQLICFYNEILKEIN